MLIRPQDQEELVRASRDLPSWTLTPGQLGELELILNGGFAPLDRFMTRADADACARDMRLADGTPFPAPVLLEVSEGCAAEAAASRQLVLRDPEGVAIAVLDVKDSWRATGHLVGGPVTGLRLPDHHDAVRLRLTPADLSGATRERGWKAVVAFPTRGIVHRAAYQATRDAADRLNGGLVLMSLADPGEDVASRHVRLRCLQAVMPRYGDVGSLWLVPVPDRGDPIVDLFLSAVIARNAGCTHLMPPAAQNAEARSRLLAFARLLDLTVLDAPAIDAKTEAELLARGERLPDSYTFPEVAEELAVAHPPRDQRGFTVFFTGLSGSGKSTIANLVRLKLLERSGRPVTLLDGDLVRQHLSSELGFSREHRDLNIRRIGFVASEITKHGGIAICAPIAPYESVRRDVRRGIEAYGGFVLVYVDTPLELCEARDRKGLYAKARAGLVREFTGISDPYEPPSDADVVIRTAEESADHAAHRIVAHLEQQGYLKPGRHE